MEKWVTAKQGARMLGVDRRNFSKWVCKYKIQRKPGKSNIWIYDLFSLHSASAPVMANVVRLHSIESANLVKEQRNCAENTIPEDQIVILPTQQNRVAEDFAVKHPEKKHSNSESLEDAWEGKPPETKELTDSLPQLCFKNPPNIVSDALGQGVIVGFGKYYDKALLDKLIQERVELKEQMVENFITGGLMQDEQGNFVKPNICDGVVNTGTIQANKIKTGVMDFDNQAILRGQRKAGITPAAIGTRPKRKENSAIAFLDRVLMRVVKAEQKIQPDISHIGTMIIGLYFPMLFLIILLLGSL